MPIPQLQTLTLAVLNSLHRRLNSQHFFPPAERPKEIVGYDFAQGIEPEPEKIADQLLLAIRERGVERFGKLQVPPQLQPEGWFHAEIATDPQTGMNVRISRMITQGLPILRCEVGIA